MDESIIVVYGFEYDRRIWDCNYKNYGAFLCKSIETDLPVYASSNSVIQYSEINKIQDEIKQIETNEQESLRKIDQMAKIRFVDKPCWRVVFYSEKLNFKGVGYESEGDENGDPR
jgi:hypothetical protein